MKKVKIAICFQDKEYQDRFLKCWMYHYKDYYEMHVLTIGENENIVETEYDLILLEGATTKELDTKRRDAMKIVYLTEDMELENEAENRIFKYEEIYKIEQKIKTQFLDTRPMLLHGNENKKVIGVFSLDAEIYQIPFCALLAAEYGENESCVLLDLQVSSGLERGNELAMDDLFVSLATKTCTSAQIQDAIIPKNNWDYVNPIKNSECIAELNKEMCELLLEMLVKEKGYRVCVINFGQMFEGCMEWMYTCDRFYMLVSKKERKTRREEAFLQELKLHGMENLQEKMIRVEMSNRYPSHEHWRDQAERLRWNEIGDLVRLQMQMGG